MNGTTTRLRRGGWQTLWPAGLLALTWAGAAGAGYGDITAAELTQHIEAYRDQPSYLHDHPEVLRSLTPPQLAQAIEALDLTHYSYLHPVVTKADTLPAAADKTIDTLSVAAVRGGELVPIPFQIDERDTEGWAYIEGASEAQPVGTPGVFDAQDELVFMYRDSGENAYDAARHGTPDGQILHELRFTHEGRTRYAYLLQGNDRRSSADYVSFDAETGKSRNTYYQFVVSPQNFLDFKDFRANVGPTQDQRVLDAIYVELATGVISPWPRLSFDSVDNIKAELVRVKDGPVRALALLKLRIVVANIPVFNIWSEVTVYDQGIVLPVSIRIPGGEVLTRILNQPRFYLALDFKDIQGGHVNAAGSDDPAGYAVVDGKLSALEKTVTISHEKNWLWLASQRGWDVWARFDLPPDWPEQLDLRYEDDPGATTDWENFPGATPRVGVDARGFPVGKLDIGLDAMLWFPDTVGPGGPLGFAREVRNPPVLQVRMPPGS